MNIFEGTRRVVYVLAFLWVGFAFFLTSESDQTPVYHYQIAWPGDKPQEHHGECRYPNEEQSDAIRRDGNVVARISVCFLAQRASNGQMLIPYMKAGEKQYFMMAPFSDTVTKYTKDTMSAAMNAGIFNDRASGIQWKRYLNTALLGAKLVFGGLLTLYVVSRLMGWIVRGFMGIPFGKDHRPSR